MIEQLKGDPNNLMIDAESKSIINRPA